MTLFSLAVVALLLFFPLSDAEKELLRFIDGLMGVAFFTDSSGNLVRSPSKSGHFFRGSGWLDLPGSVAAFPGRYVRTRHSKSVSSCKTENAVRPSRAKARSVAEGVLGPLLSRQLRDAFLTLGIRKPYIGCDQKTVTGQTDRSGHPEPRSVRPG